MKKSLITCSLVTLFTASTLTGAVWTGAVNNSWNDAGNWDGNAVPNLQTGGTAVINNGHAVDYPATDLLDLIIDNGGSLTVAASSSWIQTTTHWTQINNGQITLDAGTFTRPGGNFIVSTNAETNATVSVIGGSTLDLGGEFWLGHNTNKNNHVATVNISNSVIKTAGTVGLWAWDVNDAGNSFHINFSGTGESRIEVADRIGIRLATGEAADNQATWETFWNLGILTAEDQSGLTGAVFGDYFTTTGTNIADSVPYTLIYTPTVPEPTVGGLLLSMAGLGLRRRR